MLTRFVHGLLFETPGGGSGAGGEASGPAADAAPAESGLYAEALASTPEELRPYVTEQFKKWDASVTPKLQEAAKLRDQFGPLADIQGLSDVPAEELSSLLEFRQMVAGVEQDPTAFIDWLQNANQAMGLSPGELDEDSWLSMGEEKGWFAGDEENGNGQQDPRVDQLMQQAEQLQQWIADQESSKARSESTAQAREAMESSLTKALDESGLEGKARDEYAQAIIEYAHAFTESDDPIGQAAERIKALRGGVEGERTDRDLQQPDPALRGGRADTSPVEFRSFDDPALREAAKSRLRG